MLGRAFYLEKIFSRFNLDFDTKKAFTVYKQLYPNDVFISIISKIHQEAFGEIHISYQSKNNDKALDTSKKATLASFSGNEIVIDTTVTVTSLHGFLKDHVAGFPAYVDIWATWCVPCLVEFERSSTTKKLMDDIGIKMVYISVDNPDNVEAWLNVIKQQRLHGIHILASEELNRELKEIYELTTIPRYMITDKNADIKNRDAPRPSSLRDLIEEVDRL